ncbi:MAG: ATP-dependent DNA helicase RecG [Lachnospiraceae bacterium]|nr:ATP-dependent DNA helicase RecG [Lachnospiraceae bacterium]
MTSIREIKGVGDKTADNLEKLNILTTEDMLNFFPLRYETFEPPVSLSEEKVGELCAIKGKIAPSSITQHRKGRLHLTNFSVMADGGRLKVTVFNMPYLSKVLSKKDTCILKGVLKHDSYGFSMAQPMVYDVDDYMETVGNLKPIYRTVKGLGNATLHKIACKVIDGYDFKNDYLTDDELKRYSLISMPEAVRNMHNPSSMDDYLKARRRIVFQEFVDYILPGKLEGARKKRVFSKPMIEVAHTKRLIESLQFELTGAQAKTFEEISADMTSGYCMNRLIQGDVGSGKTIIAYLALLMNSCNGYQGAMMAPTEVLAKQHFEGLKFISEMFPDVFRPILLLGSMTVKQKKEAYELILSGEANVIIGTHAIFQDKVIYKELTLIITDEQHRFGVRQRKLLSEKGEQVHVLVMSATPIPRTLSMIMYAGLSVSVMDELPAMRKPIKNALVDEKYRNKLNEFIRKEVDASHQVYIICPMIEDNDDSELENVVDHAEQLKEIMPESYRIAYLFSKMDADKKNKIMEDFVSGNTDILVSTTVIEVGVNVPNATLMVIENAERFGLSTLHQLRGRVGRSDLQSYCVLVTDKKDKKTTERMNILCKNNNGFRIADEDMRLRGPGDIFGIRQSGDFDFMIADIYNDKDILISASEYTDRMIENKDTEVGRKLLDSIGTMCIKAVDFKSI